MTVTPQAPPVGSRVRLIAMPDDPAPVPVGTLGWVTGHGPGQVWIRWDNGRTLNLIPHVDRLELVEAP
jgi:hypothetical protein